jgi:hypothetical protein
MKLNAIGMSDWPEERFVGYVPIYDVLMDFLG